LRAIADFFIDMPGSGEITKLLLKMRAGDVDAQDRLIELVYDDLRRLAGRCMRRERAGHTLRTTALLHEAWINLVHDSNIDWQDRVHFFALAARCMRRILVEHARARGSIKRGGAAIRVEFNDGLLVSEEHLDTVLMVDEALQQLLEWDPRQAQIVEMRYFGGLTEDEVAAVLGISTRTVKRDWSMARDWLAGKLAGS
jgi:RNA polymerase sigma-70 factor, ECF subfamily